MKGTTMDTEITDVLNTEDVAGYEDLKRVLLLAYDQSARGKGKDRHARKRPFNLQPITIIPELLGSYEGLGGLVYQVIKKSQESVGMASRDRTEAAKAELLGAIVYAAAAYLHIERFEESPDEESAEVVKKTKTPKHLWSETTPRTSTIPHI